MRRRRLLIVLSLLVVALSGARASACTCAGAGSPCEALGGAAAVFVGTVTAVREGERRHKPGGEVDFTPRVATFAVEQSFFGVAETAEVSTGLGRGDCGYNFRKGTSYLVYAYRGEGGESLYTSACTRTRPAAGAVEDLQYLRGLAAAPSGVTVAGKVERALSYPGPGGQRASVPFEGATVSAEGSGGTKEARVDPLGRYKLTGVAPGALKLRLHLPDELTASRKERLLTVADRGCASEDFYVMDNGRMSGRVLDAEGQPLAGVGVVILSAGVYDIDMHSGRYGKTDEEGRWAVSALPAGRYAVGVNVRGTMRSIEPAELPKDYVCPNCYLIGDTIEADEQAGAYPRLFYPGVFRLPKAEVFLLGPGQELRDIELRLPPRPPAAVVKGRVVWADGSPAAGAQVNYRDVTHEDLIVYKYGVRADERGEFSFKAYAGGRYVVDAWANSRDPRQPRTLGRSDPRLSVAVTKPEETVTVVLSILRK